MNLNISTIVLIISLLAFLNTIILTIAWYGAKSMRSIIGFWCLSRFLVAIGVLLISLRNILPDFFTIVVANTVSLAGQVLIQEGIFRYVGKTGYLRKASFAILTVQTVLFLFFTYIQPDVNARIIVFALSTVLVCLLTIFGLFSGNNVLGAPLIFFIGLLFFQILVMVYRSAIALTQSLYTDFLLSGFLQAVGLLGQLVFTASIVICFFWLISHRWKLENQQVEETLRHSEEMHRSILSASPDGVMITDVEGRIRIVSPKVLEIFSAAEPEYFIGKDSQDFLSPEDRDRSKATTVQLLSGKPIGPQEYRGIKANGDPIELELNVDYIRDTDGLPSDIVFVVRDISERKRTEADQKTYHSVQLVLAQISEAALMAKDLDEFYQKVHFLVGQILPTRNFYIALMDETAENVTCPYCIDENSQIPLQRPVGKGLTEYVMRQGRVMLLQRTELDALRTSGEVVDISVPAQAYLGCPLFDTTGKCFGVIALISWEDEPVFRATDMDLLAIVSMQVSLGIDRKRLENELQKQAIMDELTGVFNRRHFLSRATEELKRLERYEGGCALLMLDIDHFKKVNDLYGHAAGDAALRKVAAVCEETLRVNDLFGRIGGEEFAALLSEVTKEKGLLVAQRLRQNIEDIVFHNEHGQKIELRVSIGFASRQTGQEMLADLMKRADAALYRAKAEGRNRVVMSQP